MHDALTPTDDPGEVETRLAMPIAEAMLTQRQIRRVKSDPIDDRIVLRCVELALEAPTGSNKQNWEFVIVKDRAVKARLAAQYRRAWTLYGGLGRRIRTDEHTTKIQKSVQWQIDHFEEIPVLVVCCLRGGYRVPFVPQLPIAASSHYGSIYPSAQNLLLAARSIGLGGSLITMPLLSNIVARQILKLPLSIEPCCIVALGWPKGRYGSKPREAVGTVVHLDQYGQQPWRDQAPTTERHHRPGVHSPRIVDQRPATANRQSPAIWRCKHCGALVHPANESAPVAWCARCGRLTESRRDGGDRAPGPASDAAGA